MDRYLALINTGVFYELRASDKETSNRPSREKKTKCRTVREREIDVEGIEIEINQQV
jgi:hypothetical protein